MKVVEIKVIFESDSIDDTQKEICDIFYGFGATGLKIDEPLKTKNPLDFYKDEKQFLMVDYAVSAYFPMNPYSQRRNELIKNAFEDRFNDRDDVVFTIDFYEYDEEDYQNSWKKYLYPEKVSEKFVVKPTWRDYEPEENELVIELDPGRAFGTGSHPTTSLCLKIMEENIKPGNSVIDVGTGSGILMIAAEKLGATDIYGTDIDELAVEATKENLELNKISSDIAQVYLGDLISVVKDKQFDVVVANILADVILLLLKDIFKVAKKDGLIIFSGIIEDKLPEIVKQVEEKGLEILEIKRDKEWRALLIKA
ncbi:50S ribosomal protein L11 methyltransferase [Cetobacterium somerae]|uniref:50S ribosomal protein L11 methyltransferase n=1 Tax=Cetobacterium sp. NK01 TaxID=2993530 RepID=UPI0021161374|nr:50S ribosomal protein L11 methyltransferase [Cetobacterium sp. NK01]MCQ8212555.1 50S ribosomal protein L11 methyltransferase [Cetobacterium sp. NK01]